MDVKPNKVVIRYDEAQGKTFAILKFGAANTIWHSKFDLSIVEKDSFDSVGRPATEEESLGIKADLRSFGYLD